MNQGVMKTLLKTKETTEQRTYKLWRMGIRNQNIIEPMKKVEK